MSLASHFWKHINGDVTGVGKAPLRKRFSKYRQSRIKRKRGFLGAKRIQDRTLVSVSEKEKAAIPVRLMGRYL